MADVNVSPEVVEKTAEKTVEAIPGSGEVAPAAPSVADVKAAPSNSEILAGVKALCNTTLFVIESASHPGKNTHLVAQAKQFVREILADVEAKQKAIANGAPVNLA